MLIRYASPFSCIAVAESGSVSGNCGPLGGATLYAPAARLARPALPSAASSGKTSETLYDTSTNPNRFPDSLSYRSVIQVLDSNENEGPRFAQQRNLSYSSQRAVQTYASTEQDPQRQELTSLLGVDLYA